MSLSVCVFLHVLVTDVHLCRAAGDFVVSVHRYNAEWLE